MTDLLKTKEYIDIVELNQFVTDTYGLPELGSANSFHRTLSTALDHPGQNSTVILNIEEMNDELIESREELEKYFSKEEIDSRRLTVDTFRRLIADGHLPERDEYEIEVWW